MLLAVSLVMARMMRGADSQRGKIMDWLAVQAMRWIDLDAIWHIGAAMVQMLIGGILAQLFVSRGCGPDGPVMRGGGWFVLSGLVVLSVAAAQIFWTQAIPALIGGWLGLLLLLDLTVSLLAGSLLVVLARMRARDAWGDSGRAILAVIPVANLVLLFAPSRDPQRREVAPFGFRGTAAVLVGLVLFLVVREMPKVIAPIVERHAKAALTEPEAVAAWRALAVKAHGLGPVLQEMRAGTQVPDRLDEGTTLAEVELSGHRMTLRHELDRGWIIDAAGAAAILTEACADPAERPLLQAGAEYLYVFEGVDLSPPVQVLVSAKECSI